MLLLRNNWKHVVGGFNDGKLRWVQVPWYHGGERECVSVCLISCIMLQLLGHSGRQSAGWHHEARTAHPGQADSSSCDLPDPPHHLTTRVRPGPPTYVVILTYWQWLQCWALRNKETSENIPISGSQDTVAAGWRLQAVQHQLPGAKVNHRNSWSSN